MDHLPLEIKYIIAEWAPRELSLVNREWNRIVRPILYRHLVIRFRNGETVSSSPENLLPLPGAGVLTQARRLSILAEWYPRPMPNPQGDYLLDDPPQWNPRLHGRVKKTLRQFKRLPRTLEGRHLGDVAIPRLCGLRASKLTPILDLIGNLSCLQDVDIFVHNGGPLELFEALSQHHPTCRVTIFTTRTIHKAWLTSPMLHAVHVTCLENPNIRKIIEHPDRLLQSSVLLAPNIKEIALQIDRRDMPYCKWGFNEYIPVQGAKHEIPSGKLESISWPLRTNMTAKQFQVWQTITDFGLLKSWTIGRIQDSTLLHSIVEIHPFQQLTRLALVLHPREDEDLEFWRAAGSMFKSLPPLTYLRLFGTYTPAFLNGQAISQHGSTLRTLKLQSTEGQIGPIFSTEDVVELAGQCLSLQKLSICVQRYQGLETGTWTAFSRFPCLRELKVILNCLPEMNTDMMPVPPRDLSEFEKSLIVHPHTSYRCPKWFIRDCIINCVINESLAKEFFTHIGACQDAECLTQLVICPSFDQYRSQTSGGSHFIGNHFFSELALIWTVERKFPPGLYATSRKRSTKPYIRNEFAEEASSSIYLSM